MAFPSRVYTIWEQFGVIVKWRIQKQGGQPAPSYSDPCFPRMRLCMCTDAAHTQFECMGLGVSHDDHSFCGKQIAPWLKINRPRKTVYFYNFNLLYVCIYLFY